MITVIYLHTQAGNDQARICKQTAAIFIYQAGDQQAIKAKGKRHGKEQTNP